MKETIQAKEPVTYDEPGASLESKGRRAQSLLQQTLKEAGVDCQVASHGKSRGEISPDIVMHCQAGGIEHRLAVEVKRQGWLANVLEAVGLLTAWRQREPNDLPVVVSDYLPSSSRKILRDQGIGYLDALGNAWLRVGPVYIERDFGERSVERPLGETYPLDRLVRARSSRVLRVLLEKRGATWTIPELARESGVSLGTVLITINRLAREGWVEKRRGAIRVQEPGAILDFWASRYDFKKPHKWMYYTPVRSFDDFIERLWTLPPNIKYALTGPAASLLIAPWVKFAVYHLYVAPAAEPDVWGANLPTRLHIVDKLDLRPADGANLILLDPYDEGVFYGLQRHRDVPVVCNTQLYLDLIGYPGRGREQADYFREKVLGF